MNRKIIIIDNRKPKNCMKSQILPKVGIMKLDKVVKSENWTKVGIRNHVKWQNLPKIATENRFYTKFKFVKINTVCNNSLLQWRLLDLLGMAQLFNWKFCFIFVIAWSWWFATESKLVKRCIQCIFRTGEFKNLTQQMIIFIFVELWKKYTNDYPIKRGL